MLILNRKQGEQIVIGDNIRVTVTAINGKRVELGVDAPQEFRIRREEPEKKSAKERA